jgi:tetratricopeptide (TPR) repeat protein
MSSRLLTAFALVLASVPPNLNAADYWIRLTTPHFEMFTTNSEKQGRAALEVFEQVRYFFLQNSRSKTAPDTVVRIIAFRSEEEYRPYRLNGGSFAYYLPSRKGDFIVMQDIGPKHHQVAIHEYTHLIIEHLGLTLPIWLNEGLADLYSSLEPKGNQAMVGRPLEAEMQFLRTQTWMDMNTLFGVGRDSPYYNERDKMSIFYSQSWALTHMLALGKDYSSRFAKFVAEVAAGHSTQECFQSVYGQTPADVTSALHAYVNQFSVKAAIYELKLGKSDLDPDVSEPSDLTVDLTLADLLASKKGTMAEASARLSELALSHPASPEVQESLAYLALDQGDRAKAAEYFKLAMEKGSKNPEMLLAYAGVLYESGFGAAQIVPVLQLAVTIKPDYELAWFNLGLAATNAGQFGTALNAWAHIKTVKEDQAYALFSTQAYCYLRLKSPKLAKDAAERAKQYAKNADQELQVSTLLRDAESFGQQDPVRTAVSVSPATEPVAEQTLAPERPVLKRDVARELPRPDLPRDVPSVRWSGDIQHVEAVAQSLDCSTSSRLLHVLVNSTKMIFELGDPKDVIVRNGSEGTIDLNCGAQKPVKVGIFYTPSPQPEPVDGLIRELVF